METRDRDIFLGLASLSLASPDASLCVACNPRTKDVVGTAKAGVIHWYTCDGVTSSEKELWSAIDACLASAHRTYDDVAAICACVAVRDASADLADMMSTLDKRLPAKTLKLVQSAGAAALASCTQGALHGVCVVADDYTESVSFSRGGALRHRTSGWGPLFMDGGCAYDVGSRALLAVLKAHDGRGAATALTKAFLRRLSLQRPEDLVRWAYSPPEGQQERVAGLVQVVVECATAGDAVADTILRHGVGELLRCAKTAATAVGLGPEPFKLVLAGKLLQEAGLYAHYVTEAIKEQVAGADVCFPSTEPAKAAALIALQHWNLLQQHQQQLMLLEQQQQQQEQQLPPQAQG